MGHFERGWHHWHVERIIWCIGRRCCMQGCTWWERSPTSVPFMPALRWGRESSERQRWQRADGSLLVGLRVAVASGCAAAVAAAQEAWAPLQGNPETLRAVGFVMTTVQHSLTYLASYDL